MVKKGIYPSKSENYINSKTGFLIMRRSVLTMPAGHTIESFRDGRLVVPWDTYNFTSTDALRLLYGHCISNGQSYDPNLTKGTRDLLSTTFGAPQHNALSYHPFFVTIEDLRSLHIPNFSWLQMHMKFVPLDRRFAEVAKRRDGGITIRRNDDFGVEYGVVANSSSFSPEEYEGLCTYF